ncbi:MAG TPA: chitobiase/beta-hexosaminidase C-terminal domain-containing protein [Acidobacteriaceae bacterium]|nr:chitobiase/beta-hexosaminidase C-terminal domain-containing protein [Acidobacteriaceae bacterium]
MRLVGADTSPNGKDLLEGRSNYLIGSDTSKWIRDIRHFRQIEYNHIYPGISLAFYGNGDALEHDFQIEPEADPARISFRFDGAQGVSISSTGDLEVRAVGQTMTLRKPKAYQTTANGRAAVDAGFVLGQDGTVGFRLGTYDHTLPMVIDPVFVFSTYLGGTGIDQAAAVTTDAAGNIYLTGLAGSTDFPTVNPVQPHLGACSPYEACSNVFITKLNPSGTKLIYSTYLGGSSQDSGTSIAVDANGNTIVAGLAMSSDFPKAGAIQSPTCQINYACYFLASLKPDGTALNYSGMIGGTSPGFYGEGGHVAVDSAGNAYLTGTTWDSNFQITPGTLATSAAGYPYQELFILKVDTTGKLIYSTMVPGNAAQDAATNNNQFLPNAIVVDASGQATVAGSAGPGLPTTSGVIQAAFPYDTTNNEDLAAGFVLQVNSASSAVNYASYLPGTSGAGAITVDAKGDLYFSGWTNQPGLPVKSNAYQKVLVDAYASTSAATSGYILELTPKATGPVAATYLNGAGLSTSEYSQFSGIALDSRGNIYVGGMTESLDFPLLDPFTTVLEGVQTDLILAAVTPDMSSLLFGSFLNGPEALSGASTFSGIAIDNSDKLIVVGETSVLDFPTTAESFEPELPPSTASVSYSGHSFIAKIDMSTPAPSACLSSVNIGFGDAAVGQSAAQTLNVTNCGNAPLSLTSIVSSDPSVTASQSCSAVPAGASCPVTFTFKPTVNGNFSGVITISDNAVLPPPAVSFTAISHAPQITAQPSSAVFPAQVLGVASSGSVYNLLVRNTGGEFLVVDPSKTTISGDFSIVNNGCTSSVSAGGSCFIQLGFTPTQLGQRTGTLSIASNDPVHPVLSVPLSGTAVATYPIAAISLLMNPSYPVSSATASTTVTMYGTNFFPSSVVYVNGAAQPTTYQNSTSLSFTLSPAMFSAMAELSVTVVNPAPGGGSSAPYPLTIYLSLQLQASSLVIDPVGGLLYAAIPASATQNPSTIIRINPATGAMMTPIAVSSDPQVLAVSNDGSELYVGTSAGVLQRINLKTLAIEKTFNLPIDAEWGQTYPHEMHVVPGSPKSIVVELFANVSPEEDGAALYNDSGLVNWVPGVDATTPLHLDSFTFTSPTTIYGLPEGSTFFAKLQVSPTGLSVISPSGFECCNETTGSQLASDGTLLYTNSGQVWNPATQTLLGSYYEPSGEPLFYAGRPLLDISNGYTLFLDNDSSYGGYGAFNIDIYDQKGYGFAGSVPFVNAGFSNASDLVRWGSNGLAFRNYDNTGFSPGTDQIVILTTSKVNSNSNAPVPIVTSLSPSSVYAGGPAYKLQVNGSGFTSASTILINGAPRSTAFVSAESLTTQLLASDIASGFGLNVQVATPAPGGGTSNTEELSINIQTPTVTVTPSLSTLPVSQPLTLNISVRGASGYPTPTGTVALSNSIYNSAAIPLSNGNATITISAGSLTVGSDGLFINYVPDAGSAPLYNKVNGSTTVTVTANSAVPTPAIYPPAGTYTTTQTVSLSDAMTSATIYYTNNGTTPTTSSTKYTAPITVASSQTIQAIAVEAGYTNSAVAGDVYIIKPVLPTPTFNVAEGIYPTAQTVAISDTTAGTTIYYTTNGTTPTTSSSVYSSPITVSASETVKAIAVNSRYTNSAVGIAVYTIGPAATVPKPILSPAAGTYPAAQTVTISEAMAGAIIYYTTNGTAPTTSSTIYTGPIYVGSSQTIQAIAIQVGYINSTVAGDVYIIKPVLPTPIFSLVAGSYATTQTVTINEPIADSTIYYTTNGTTPTTSSTVYSGPITVSVSETVKAIAANSRYTNSAVATAAYMIGSTTLPTPTLFPGAGTYTAPQTVTMSDATPGATIYYTTNGTAPTTSSSVYSGPIAVSASETILAIAIKTNSTNSAVATAVYTINIPTTLPKPTLSPAAGTYTTTQMVTISDATPGTTIYYTNNGTIPTVYSTRYTGPITVASSQTLQAIAVEDGYTNSVAAGDVYIIKPVLPTPTFSVAGVVYTSAQTVTISDAIAATTIYYTTDGTTPTTSSTVYSGPITVNVSETIEAIAVKTSYTNSAVATATYTIGAATTLPKPTLSPAAGTYTTTQMITISDATAGTTIYYTNNGATPTASSTRYTGPITVASSQTLQAIAVEAGYTNSTVAGDVYIIKPVLPTPTFSLAAGTYTTAQTITISDATAGTTIYYTTDGTTPTTSSTVYSGLITMSASETIQAIAVKTSYTNSAVAAAVYTVGAPTKLPKPTLSPAAGTYTTTQMVTISDTTPGTAIYYTNNGTMPTTSSARYAGPITVASSQTLQAVAVEAGYTNSAAAGDVYIIKPVLPTPAFSVAGGVYTSAQTVTISDATAGTTIYYTANGTTPTTSSSVYSGPISVSASEIIEAIAVKTSYTNSAVATATYTIE